MNWILGALVLGLFCIGLALYRAQVKADREWEAFLDAQGYPVRPKEDR